MTKAQRQAARERCEAATPATGMFSWYTGNETEEVEVLDMWPVFRDGPRFVDSIGYMKNKCDQAFVAHARGDLPAALDALDEADAVLALHRERTRVVNNREREMEANIHMLEEDAVRLKERNAVLERQVRQMSELLADS